jgi:hypothetical protein
MGLGTAGSSSRCALGKLKKSLLLNRYAVVSGTSAVPSCRSSVACSWLLDDPEYVCFVIVYDHGETISYYALFGAFVIGR